MNGGVIAGQQVGPVTFIIASLAQTFAPLGEEVRLQALNELMTFHRRPGERIDELQSRFRVLRHRAQSQGAGLAMSWEGYSWMMLKACGVGPTQLI